MVITIIGILIGLLLPAVQAAREAARRLQCANNLKQISLALHNYHAANNAFPPGNLATAAANHGFSWWVRVLPYIEQRALYDSLDHTSAQIGWSGNVPGAGNVHNHGALYERAFPLGVCPSSPLPQFSWPYAQSFSPSYTGVAGSVEHPTAVDSPIGSGRVSGGGVLIEGRAVDIAYIRDGTTNTMMLAETSDWCRTASGEQHDCRTDCLHGFQMSGRQGASDRRTFNITTVRHRMNEKSWNASGVNASNCGNNRPIQSAHPGGAQAAMADGSVHFLNESIDVQILYNLADRDDGNVLPGGLY